jgi:hypothetical protein
MARNYWAKFANNRISRRHAIQVTGCAAAAGAFLAACGGYGALSMSEDEIRARLRSEGYQALLEADPGAPGKIKAAAAKEQLGVWTPHHLVTLDDSRIDARPAR